VLVVDPSDDSIECIPCCVTGEDKFSGGALMTNGSILCVPGGAECIMEVLPHTMECRSFGSYGSLRRDHDKWCGAQKYQRAEIVLCAPFDHSSVLEVDATQRTVHMFGDTGKQRGKWNGVVLTPTGALLCVPFCANAVLMIQPITRGLSYFGDFGMAEWKWVGGALGPDGLVYCAPKDANDVLVLDTNANTQRTLPCNIPGISKWCFPTAATDGNLYCFPCSAASVLRIEPVKGTTTIDEISYQGRWKWRGCAVANDGALYSTPFDSSVIAVLDFHETAETATTHTIVPKSE